MRFKHSSSMAPMERKKKNKQSPSCMASFFNFFAKRSFFSSKKKFLPSIHTPKKWPSQKTNKTNLVLEGKKDETGTSTSTEPLKKSRSLVVRLMGLDTIPAKPQSIPVTLESVQTNLSSIPTLPNPPPASKSMQEKPINASETVQNEVFKTPPLASKSVQEKSPLVTNAPENVQSVVWKPLKIPPLSSRSAREKSTNASECVQNIVWKPLTNPSLKTVQEKTFKVKSNASESTQNRVSKPFNQNQKFGSDSYPTRLVKSPPRSVTPTDNVKLLEAAVKVLDIRSEPVMTRFVNPEKFGSKLNDALSDLDELKDNTSNNSCNNSINSNNNKGGTKRDVSPNRGIGTGEIKRDLQKSLPNRRKSQEKTLLKHNNLKQNKSDQVSKDFIALNRSMLNNTALRKKYLGVETKTESKNSVKRPNKQNNINNNNSNNNNNTNADMKTTEGVSEKRAGNELIIRKGAGQMSEKPPVFKNRAKSEKGEDMSIVSFTFSSPLKNKHVIRDFSRVYKEENNDNVVMQKQEDGNRKSPVSILQATLLNNDSSSSSSNGISDLEMKETPPIKTEQKKFENENKSIVLSDNINTKKNIISSTKIATNKLRISSETESNIQLFLQNILMWNPKGRQVSSFINDTTKTILETLYMNSNNLKEENYFVRNCVSDFIVEHLDLLQNRVLDFGYNSWKKFRVFYTKEKIVKEIEKETLKLRNLEGNSSEILVEKDMENWDELGLNFEIGVQIEKEIISQLIGEIVTDLVK